MDYPWPFLRRSRAVNPTFPLPSQSVLLAGMENGCGGRSLSLSFRMESSGLITPKAGWSIRLSQSKVVWWTRPGSNRRPPELDNPDNRVLLAFFFIFSEMWVAEFLAQRFDVTRAREGNWRERRDSNPGLLPSNEARPPSSGDGDKCLRPTSS
jgi:hypothetical protein